MVATELSFEERMSGLLLGGAVGDALGAPVEFLDRQEILAAYGSCGVREFAPAYGRRGAITDDTQMTLFTLEGLIRAQVRFVERGICHVPSVVDHAYRRWLLTQELGAGAGGPVESSGWLIQQRELWSRRAPGHTCISSLQSKPSEFGRPARNNSKGAGGIMRVAPVGLYCSDAFSLAGQIAELTHGHVTSTVASGWFARVIQLLGQGAAIRFAAEQGWNECRGLAPELDDALELGFRRAETPAQSVPEDLGGGWIAEEAAAIAIWCALTADDPVDAISLAVNIGGDSDTTGSLVGQMLGAMHGTTWIPPEWLSALEARDVICTLARDAAASLRLERGSAGSDDLTRRYPGW